MTQSPHTTKATNDNQNPWTAFSDIAFNARIRDAVVFLTGKESSAAVSAEFAGAGGRFAGRELTSGLSCASTPDRLTGEAARAPTGGKANAVTLTAPQAELAATAGAELVRLRSLSTSLERVDVREEIPQLRFKRQLHGE